MTTPVLSNVPVQQFQINGVPLSGGKLFTYAAGTTTKQATYTDSTGSTQNTNPIIINSQGFPQTGAGQTCGVWADPTLSYKYVLAPSTDTDPPTNPIWSVDNITASAPATTAANLAAYNGFSITPSGTVSQLSLELFRGLSMEVYASGDTAASAATAGTNIPSLVGVEHAFGGSAVNDGRNALGVHLRMTGATSASNTYRYYAAGNFIGDSGFNDNGTAGTPQGYLYGLGGVAYLKTGATYWRSAIAGDFEVCVATGASSQVVAGVSSLQWPAHATQGTLVDASFWASAAVGAVGMTNAIQIDDSAGKFPVTTTGDIIKATGAGSPTVTNGIDFYGITISSYLLRGGGTILASSNSNATGQYTGAIQVPNGGVSIGGNLLVGGVKLETSKTITAPTTGSTVTIGASTYRTIINPAGTLAALTVALPTALADGDTRRITFSKAITALTWTGTTAGFPTTAAANTSFAVVWDQGTATWYLA